MSGSGLESMFSSLIVISGQASFIFIVFSCLCFFHTSKKSPLLFVPKDKSSASKVKFRQDTNCCKRLFETGNLAYTNETKDSITSQELGSRDSWRIANSVFIKGNSVIAPLFNGPKVLSSAYYITKLLAENFSKNSNLDGSGIPLPAFPSITNLKLHNVHVTPLLDKNIMANFDSIELSGPDCISVVAPKNCELELSPTLADLLNMCLKESCFPDCWKVSSVGTVFKNVVEKSTAKNYRSVSLLSVVIKILDELVNNRLVNHLEMWLFFLISSMVSGFFNQLQIFWQWYLIELLGLLIGQGHLIYPKLSKGFDMSVFFTSSIPMKFQVR